MAVNHVAEQIYYIPHLDFALDVLAGGVGGMIRNGEQEQLMRQQTGEKIILKRHGRFNEKHFGNIHKN